MMKQDLKKKDNRKWPGIGKNPLEIDFSAYPGYEEYKKPEAPFEEVKKDAKAPPPAAKKGAPAGKGKEEAVV